MVARDGDHDHRRRSRQADPVLIRRVGKHTTERAHRRGGLRVSGFSDGEAFCFRRRRCWRGGAATGWISAVATNKRMSVPNTRIIDRVEWIRLHFAVWLADFVSVPFIRSRNPWNTTYRIGMTKTPRKLAAIMPPNTGVPTLRRA